MEAGTGGTGASHQPGSSFPLLCGVAAACPKEGGRNALSAAALSAYVLGSSSDDIVDGLLEELVTRIVTLRSVLTSDPSYVGDVAFDVEMFMLERRAEVARELVRRTRRSDEDVAAAVTRNAQRPALTLVEAGTAKVKAPKPKVRR